MQDKCQFQKYTARLKIYKPYIAGIFLSILITVVTAIFDTVKPVYKATGTVLMNERILVDLNVLTSYLKPHTPFEIRGCNKIGDGAWFDYKVQLLPYSNKGFIIVESRNFERANEALNFLHTCSVNVFKRSIEPYELELKILNALRERIDLRSIDVKYINEFYKFHEKILDYELMKNYIEEPLSLKINKIDLQLGKYLAILFGSMIVIMTFIFMALRNRK